MMTEQDAIVFLFTMRLIDSCIVFLVVLVAVMEAPSQ
jgi:hypothetical protein